MSESDSKRLRTQIFIIVLAGAILSFVGNYFATAKAVERMQTQIEMQQRQLDKIDDRFYLFLQNN